jgi:hypothetical protein
LIRRRFREALAWRFGAVVTRLDSLHARLDAVDARVQAIDGRFGEGLHARLSAQEARLDAIEGALRELDDSLARLTSLAGLMPRASEDALAARNAIESRVEPMLRAIVDEESGNRRRLFRLRATAAYDEAFTVPDPLVSVTIATLGRDALLMRALPSLLAQTYTNIEVLVVGDAVSPEVEKGVEALADPRVHFANLSQRLIADPMPGRHRLVGSTMARNEAARRASGLWLVHFDDDDYLRPGAIAALLELARQQRVEVAYGGFETHQPAGNSTTVLGFPPRAERFAWPAALMHGGLRFLERELVASALDLPGDIYMLERALRAGVRFAMLDDIVLDYFPAQQWDGREERLMFTPTPDVPARFVSAAKSKARS